MRTHFSSSSGFSMTSVLVSMGIAGLISMILMQNMDNLRTISDSERNMQMRTELFQSMSQLTNLVDCSATISGVDTSEIPPKGKKISLLQQGSGDILVSTLGARRGLFSYVADIMPDSSIRLRAAAFKEKTSNPRKEIDSGNKDLFLKVGKRVWDFELTDKVKEKYFPSLSTLCQGASLAVSIPSGASAVCYHGPQYGQSVCGVLDPLTGHFCQTAAPGLQNWQVGDNSAGGVMPCGSSGNHILERQCRKGRLQYADKVKKCLQKMADARKDIGIK